MTVLLVMASEDDGGLARVAATLASALPAHGIRIVVALQREGRVGSRLAASGVPVHVVPELIETLDRSADGRSSPAAIARNVRNVPRAVHALRALAQECEASLFYSHGSWPNHLVAEATRDRSGDQCGAVWHVHSAFNPVNQLIARTMLSRGDVRRVIAVSESAASPYRRAAGKVEVVHNGVSICDCQRATLAPLLRRRLGLDADAFLVGYAGRLVVHKGIRVIVGAAQRILKQVPNAHIVVLGGNPASARSDALGDLKRELGHDDRVHLCGYVDDALPHIADFDVALTPSIYADPCPLSVIEALAVGVPVVASRIGGIPELVDGGIDGVLVVPGDADSLANAVIDLAAHPARRQAMANEARRRAADRFDESRMVASVATILKSAARQTHRHAQL